MFGQDLDIFLTHREPPGLICGNVKYAPADPFTTSELQNPLHDVPELNKIRRSPESEALKL